MKELVRIMNELVKKNPEKYTKIRAPYEIRYGTRDLIREAMKIRLGENINFFNEYQGNYKKDVLVNIEYKYPGYKYHSVLRGLAHSIDVFDIETKVSRTIEYGYCTGYTVIKYSVAKEFENVNLIEILEQKHLERVQAEESLKEEYEAYIEERKQDVQKEKEELEEITNKFDKLLKDNNITEELVDELINLKNLARNTISSIKNNEDNSQRTFESYKHYKNRY